MTLKCPMCGVEAVVMFRPFCSKRCADLDLSSWLEGKYRMSTDEEGEIDDFVPQ